MSSASPQSEVFVMRSLTPAEVDHLATLSAISFVVGALVQFMGGDLEATFGPVALLVTYTAYSLFAVVFAFGYWRMCFAVFRQRATPAADREV